MGGIRAWKKQHRCQCPIMPSSRFCCRIFRSSPCLTRSSIGVTLEFEWAAQGRLDHRDDVFILQLLGSVSIIPGVVLFSSSVHYSYLLIASVILCITLCTWSGHSKPHICLQTFIVFCCSPPVFLLHLWFFQSCVSPSRLTRMQYSVYGSTIGKTGTFDTTPFLPMHFPCANPCCFFLNSSLYLQLHLLLSTERFQLHSACEVSS